jgi:Sushi repeat (SCR repeat)
VHAADSEIKVSIIYKMLQNSRCFAGVNCSSITVANANPVNSTAVTFDSYVNVTCNPGFQFSDNTSWIVTSCRENKMWSPPVNCIRELLYLMLFCVKLYSNSCEKVLSLKQ